MTFELAPKATWDIGWRPDPSSVAALARLEPGSELVVAKRAPSGIETTRYPATVAATRARQPWIEVVATWDHGRIEVAGLAFEPGDTLREFFSAEHPYNAFAVFSPQGKLRGWYGNVTYPAFVDTVAGQDLLVWHDLFLDVVILPDGTMHLLDDDELAASAIPADQDFAAAIEQARRDLIETIPILGISQPDVPSGLGAGEATTKRP